MTKKLQFGLALLAAAGFIALPVCGAAQKPANPHPDRPPQRQNAQRPFAHPRANAAQPAHPQVNGNGAGNPNANGPRNNFANENGARNGTGANFAPRSVPPQAHRWVDTMRSLTPGQREQVFQHSKAFQNLSPDIQSKIRQQFNQWDRMTPQARTDLQTKERVWGQLTPEQKQHLKNDVWPKWQQMPWQRRQIMKQKLNVLQNMPESARNQRLNDPEFTRGMSDDEKSMLHDLSHTHVGGVPEPPSE